MKRLGLLAAAAGLVAFGLHAGTAGAHDTIAGSTPPNGAVLTEPITEASIDFGEEVSGVELAIIGPDDSGLPLESTTVAGSPTVVKIEFEELSDEGEYIVRYLAPVTADGHTLAGAISFTYGSAGGSTNTTLILVFCAVAIVVLSTGAVLSYRRYRALTDGDDVDGDVDLADAGV